MLLIPLLCALGCAPAEPDPTAPDVVLIVVDTLRADYLGLYGFPGETSPRLDALATDAAIFERAIAASSLTAPSHASMMTSRFVRSHSIGYQNGTTRLAGGTTLAEAFEAAGYDTAAFIGNTVIGRQTGLDRGFALYDDKLPERERNRPDYFERTALPTTERALAWLERPRSAPYFLWVHYQDPHGPYTPPAPWSEGLEVPAVPGEAPLRLLPQNSGKRGLPAYQYLPGIREPQRYRERYAGEIRHFDTQLGRLMAAVEAASPERETVWLFTADHGESLGEDEFWFAHGHATTPDLARVPFIVRGPGVTPGRYHDLVHHVDVMPTLLALAGLEPRAGAQGIDLSQRLQGGPALAPRVVFSDIGNDTSAYSGDHFFRVSGPREALADDWKRYRWSDAGQPLPRTDGRAGADWRPEPSAETTLRTALEQYRAAEAPLVPAQSPDEAQRERLHALGYIDDDGAPQDP